MGVVNGNQAENEGAQEGPSGQASKAQADPAPVLSFE